ncbi:ShlB/FhaC/HecB family hemolysin secretion/activation protein [Paraburkholderia bonniea]|uniref:ShlB/FhaC/HecB family hemolysin secretion/activation protein n=1 Tax=Paraburkholderia bonniea TaxID=2152891 RepID=UPI001291483B|nr:ShlB/FhaC/HecB family hemolysin secretion/activation protein [Paraburkholderia bonniea]WJF89114.1 ShlB/FhaC/HecB family hemolysin secretion/activation protein [Paraburkholderia bonniea]WJF92430.1 ShlB/FhaC/HecB family hemolysin secretion/activation protein [Paraburkholderia bonniea]
MKIRNKLAALPFTALVSLASNAQHAPTPADKAAAARANAEQNQQIQQQRDAQQRDTVVQAPAVRSTLPVFEDFPPLPIETPCFRIHTFTFEVPATLPDAVRNNGASALAQDPFAFAREWLEHYRGQSANGSANGSTNENANGQPQSPQDSVCLGKSGIDTLVKGLQQAILSRGYLTTRVLIPQQDLSSGTLAFTLIPGVVRQLRFANPETRGTLSSAFPVRPNDLLNLRDLEQGLEQMKRVASQDVEMQIEPTGTLGESDVVLTVQRSKPWSFVASVDNSGADATGKWQGNVSLGIDNPLGLNDVFTAGANQDLSFGNKSLGSHGFNGSYSVPWGYWTATLSGSSNTYYQNIAGVNQTFVSSGNSQTAALRLARVLSRNQSGVSGIEFQLSKRFGKSFIDDTDIAQQRRNNTFIEVGLTNRHYFGAAQFDGTLAYRQGIGGLGATPDPYPSGPTYRYRMAVLDANLSLPFAVAQQRLRYVTTVHAQFTNDTLFYLDDLAIGSRYTVRGFDGETMLAAEKGFYWRNELQWPIGQTKQALYAGIDYGRVFGPNTVFLAGTQLAGAVIGIKGGLPSRFAALSYDLFIGAPLYKPSGLPASRVSAGMQATAQF